MKLFIKHFLFVNLLFWANTMQSQDVRIKASLDKNNFLIGDAIELTLSASYNPLKYSVRFPILNDTFNHFEIVEKSKIDTVLERENSTFIQKYTITNFDSGVWQIPSFSFQTKSLQAGVDSTFNTDSILVNINTVVVDTSKPFKPIFGIRKATMPLSEILKYVVGGMIVLAILIFGIYYLIKKRREKNKNNLIKVPEISLLPHEKALQSLNYLEEENLWQKGEEKQYHTALTDIIRQYLEEQFNLDCFDKTSSEIISQVKRIIALSTSRKNLRTLFETADMVKFAKSKPTPEQHIESMQIAKEVILESYKKIKPIDNKQADQ